MLDKHQTTLSFYIRIAGFIALSSGFFVLVGFEIGAGSLITLPFSVTLLSFALLYVLVKKRISFPFLLIFILGFEQFRLPTIGLWGTTSKLGGIILFTTYALVRMQEAKSSRVLWSKHLILQLFYVLFMALSIFWAIRKDQTLVGILSFSLLLTMTLLTLDFARDSHDLQRFLIALIIYGLILSAYGIYDFAVNRTSSTYYYLRSGSLSSDPNIAASYMVTAGGVLLGMITVALNPFRRKLLLIGGPILAFLIVGILSTASRGGFIGLATIIGFSIIHTLHKKRGLVTVFVLAISLGLLLSIINLYFPDLFLGLRIRFDPLGPDNPTGNRLVLWQLAQSLFLRHPINGIGLASFQYHPGNPFGNTAHGLFPEVLAEGGIIGFTLFLSILSLTIYDLFHIRRLSIENKNETLALISSGILWGLLALISCLIFLDGSDDKFLWLLLALSQALKIISPRHFEKGPNKELQRYDPR